MKPARDSRIDTYIEKSAPFARPILHQLRARVLRACPAAVESMKWGMPHFEYAGGILCGMAAFKAHCTFGFWHQGMEKVLGADGAKAESAMGSLGRITRLEDLPADLTLRRYLRAAVQLADSGAPARPRPLAKKKEARVPSDLAEALRVNAMAARTFSNFSPSHRREYVEWIEEAKRSETRQKRLASTVAWLGEGKSRNWKYENC